MKKFYLLLIISIFSLNLYCQIVWKKYPGNPILNPGSAGEWDKEFVGIGSVIYLDTIYHMWYTGGSFTGTLRIGHATSPDGITWRKDTNNPVLDRGPVDSWDESTAHAPNVLFINDTFHMWYTGHRGNNWDFDFQIGHATSPDGINWTKDPNNPVLPRGTAGTWDYAWICVGSVIYDGNGYHMWYMGYNGTDNICIGHATSTDGLTWTKDPSNPVLTKGNSTSWDYPRVDLPTVLFNGNIYQMWYSGGNLFNGKIGYATSIDGSEWTKSPYNPVLTPGQTGSWDAGSVSNMSVIDSSGVKYKMWYWGSNAVNTASIGYAEALSCYPPPQPGSISGNGSTCNGATETYSVINDPGVTYSWKVTGGTVSGIDTSNSVNIIWNSGGNQTITVTPSNTCGSGMPNILPVIVKSVPSQPDTITGEINPGINDTCDYAIQQVPGAISYTWTVSQGGNIIENNDDNISVVWVSPGNQTISVYVSNSCGDGEPYILPVITDIFNLQSNYIISVYPNPANEIINIEIGNSGEKEMKIELLNVSGQVIYRIEYRNINDQLIKQIDLSGYSRGIYFLRIRQAGAVYNRKIVVM